MTLRPQGSRALRHYGMECFGKLPAHWKVRRLASVVDIRVSNVDKHSKPDETPVRLCNYVDVYYNDRVHGELTFMPATASEGEITKFRLARGDVLITKDSEDWKDIAVPALVEYAADDLLCGYHVALLRPTAEVLGGFVLRTLQSPQVAWQFQVAASGVTRYGLTRRAIRTARVAIPPLPEQRVIVRFLDAADRRIQRYIRAKERLIELLEEQKQAIIHQAITGQIDVRIGQPYPAYKDSGVAWLGEVPEHWDVRKVGSIFQCKGSGTTPSGDRFFGGGIPWIMSGDLNDGIVASTARSVTDEALERFSALKIYPPKSLVVAMYGATIGRTGILSMEACTNQACFVAADPSPRTNVLFAQAVLVSARKELVRRSQGGSQPNINAEVLKRFRVPSPPGSEQGPIIAYLRDAVASLDAAERGCRRLVTLAREYRNRLIADVVSGKLEVREAAASLRETDPLTADDPSDSPAAQVTTQGDITNPAHPKPHP